MKKNLAKTFMDSSKVKDYYDLEVPKKYSDNYEYNRWFSKRRNWEEYRMTYNSLNKFLKSKNLSNAKVFELGPGAGTWTRLFLTKGCRSITLLDQSVYMIKQAKLNLGLRRNLRFINEDFLTFKSEEKYNFFFSARTIEYIPDKRKVINKIFNLLSEKGVGAIITKNPISKISILKRKIHQNQINPFRLKKISLDKGFTNIEIRPVVIRFPFKLNIHAINSLIHNFVKNKELNYPLSMITESYLISFEK
jgi:ubiquinone/menaquinone biosynthesis C-methylase UbiE